MPSPPPVQDGPDEGGQVGVGDAVGDSHSGPTGRQSDREDV